MHLCLQVEEEATDKDNKNCSKDGMCGKVRLCLPLSSLIPVIILLLFLFWCFIQFLFLLCLSLCFLPLVSVSITEYFPAAEAQKGWGHLGREIVTS